MNYVWRAAFTPRQNQAIDLLLQGMKDKDIAAELGLNYMTVKTRFSLIYRRAGVKSRMELMALANRFQGLSS